MAPNGTKTQRRVSNTIARVVVITILVLGAIAGVPAPAAAQDCLDACGPGGMNMHPAMMQLLHMIQSLQDCGWLSC